MAFLFISGDFFNMRMIMRIKTRYSGSTWTDKWSSISWASGRIMSTFNDRGRSMISIRRVNNDTGFLFLEAFQNSHCWREEI